MELLVGPFDCFADYYSCGFGCGVWTWQRTWERNQCLSGYCDFLVRVGIWEILGSSWVVGSQ